MRVYALLLRLQLLLLPPSLPPFFVVLCSGALSLTLCLLQEGEKPKSMKFWKKNLKKQLSSSGLLI